MSLVLTKQGPLELYAGKPTAYLKASTCRAEIPLPWGVLETSVVTLTTSTLNTGQSPSNQESALCRAAHAGRVPNSAMLTLALTAGFYQLQETGLKGKAHSDLPRSKCS